MGGDVAVADAAEIEALAAGKHGQGQFVRRGSGEDENDVGRRLLQGLQQGVEGLRSQHMHFVDDVDLVFFLGRGEAHPVPQVADIVDAAVGRAVDLDEIKALPGLETTAGRAFAAGVAAWQRAFTVDGPGQDAGGRSLARAAGTAEQIGVDEALAADRSRQHPGDMRLSHQLSEAAGPVTAVKRGVGHSFLVSQIIS